tara:strand:+ start:812 stop:1309 length:498 start_codon:yes stop_codon:yes gene_type:complete
MEELIYQFSPYAPAAILIAAALDIFFITGYILYGFAMLASVLMMYTSGMIGAEAILITAFLGTTIGNSINYWIGRFFGETEFVRKRLTQPRAQKARHFLQHRGLIIFMVIGRFITFTRPMYALILGSMRIKFRRFLMYEIPLAFFWVAFWLFIILQGEEVVRSAL